MQMDSRTLLHEKKSLLSAKSYFFFYPSRKHWLLPIFLFPAEGNKNANRFSQFVSNEGYAETGGSMSLPFCLEMKKRNEVRKFYTIAKI